MLNNGTSTSAGVYTGEEDNSVRATAISPSIGAMVGPSRRGPVGVPTLNVSKERFRARFGNPDPSLTYAHYCAEQFLSEASQFYYNRVARNALFGSCRVVTVDNFAQVNSSVQGFDSPDDYAFNENDILFLYAENPGNWNNDLKVVLYPDVNDYFKEMFVLEVYEGNSSIPVESYNATLRDKVDGFGRQLSIETQLEEQSFRLRARVNRLHPTYVKNEATRLVNAVTTGVLTYGNDGDTITEDDIIEGWEAFADVEEISVSLLINGGYSTPSVQLKMIEIAESRDDCFAILDLPGQYQKTQQAVNYRRNLLNVSTSYAALYGPDLLIKTDEGTSIYVPPSGYVAACYARTDRVAAEWFAPAGVNRGKVAADGLREIYLQGDRDTLDQNQINFIHKMPNYGLVVWAQETLQSFSSALSNVHVRRLLNTIKNTLKYTTMSGVYEPNDEFLRLELERISVDFLDPIVAGRGLYGYEVICDATNNTAALIANGDLIIDIYIDPMMVNKRIHLNAVVPKTGQIQFAIEQLEGTR